MASSLTGIYLAVLGTIKFIYRKINGQWGIGGEETLARLNKIVTERDHFRRQLEDVQARFLIVDPERFIDKLNDLSNVGNWEYAAELCFNYTNAQSEALGLAATCLIEQRLIDSETHGKVAIDEAQRFAAIGLAADPGSKRLVALCKTIEERAELVANGEPIEVLNWGGMSDVQLNMLSIKLKEAGQFVLAEIAARRSVPLARARTGEASYNYCSAVSVHASSLIDLKRYHEAEELVRHILKIHIEKLDRKPALASTFDGLGVALGYQGKLDEAVNAAREAIKIDNAAGNTNELETARYRYNLGMILRRLGQLTEAETYLEQSLAVRLRLCGDQSADYSASLSGLSMLRSYQGRESEALDLHNDAIKILEGKFGPCHPITEDYRSLRKFILERKSDQYRPAASHK